MRRRTPRRRRPPPLAEPRDRSDEGPLAEALLQLQELTRRLRRDCPWDREQTARTIVPHTVEEAYEVADAANAGDPVKLLDELGDLLFQAYFLALLLEEQGEGDLEAVARSVHAKLVRRHPHVFGDAEADTAGRVRERWEAIKTEQEGRTGIFHDVPEALPGLLHARKVQRRAASTVFDWPDLDGVIDKIAEEATELLEAETPDHRAEEYGDLLFVIVNLGRKLGIDPESALRAASRKFASRFARVERFAAERQVELRALGLDALDELWQEAKLEEAAERDVASALPDERRLG